MNKVSITLSAGEERMEALELFLKKEGSSVQKKMEEALNKLYEEAVPEPVREYLDAKAGGKMKRPASPTKLNLATKSKPDRRKDPEPHEEP